MLPKVCHENQAILLSHATECLAKAALALSEVAEAVAEATKSFISDTSSEVSLSQTPEDTQTNTGINAILDYESDSDSVQLNEGLPTSIERSNDQRVGNERNLVTGTAGGNFTSHTTGAEEYLSGQCTLQGVQSNHNPATAPHPPADDAAVTETIDQASSRYRILLDDEADVLLAACCLIRQGPKTICYVHSPTANLNLYKAILSVVEVPVHKMKKSSIPQDLEQTVQRFQEDHRSVLLLPATVSPTFRINDAESMVIHIGWPPNEQLYKEQVAVHHAKNNVLVAYSGDQDIYPSCSSILMQTHPWPQDEQLFQEACTALRPQFNKRLDEIPSTTKARIYSGWIHLHGYRGPYKSSSWTPSTLVSRANLYLLNVLRYNPGDTGFHSGALVNLPEVSAGFATSQHLESAVEDGLLRVKSSSGPNHISSLSLADEIPASTAFLNEEDASNLSNKSNPKPGLVQSNHSGTTLLTRLEMSNSSQEIPGPNPELQLPRSASRISSINDLEGNRSLESMGYYLIIELEERDLVCENLSTFEPLASMLEQMVMKPVFSVRNNSPLSEDIRNALDSPSGCIVLCDMHSQLPTSLQDKPICLSIYLGWLDNLPLYQGQAQRGDATAILLRRELQASNGPDLLASLGRANILQASAATKRRYNRRTEDSTLALGRKQWQELILANTSVLPLRSAYMAWITHHSLGRHKEAEWTAVNLAKHANKYFMGLFRCGSDGGALQDRPLVTPGFVRHLGLEDAVAGGLLTVKE